MEDLLSQTEAAALLGISDRTLRRRAREVRLPVHLKNGRCFYERAMLHLIGPGSDTAPAGADRAGALDRGSDRADRRSESVLTERLKGAHTAAKLSSLRRRDADRERERLEAERDRLCGQVEFLQQQLSSARDAERELRLLLAQSVNQACVERERRALPRWRWWRIRE